MAQAQVRKHRIEPLWDRVDRNRVELVLWELLFLVSCVVGTSLLIGVVLIIVLIYSMQEPGTFDVLRPNLALIFLVGNTVAVLLGASWMAFAITRSEKWLLRRLDATLSPRGDLLPTKYALKDMAIASGFDVAPALYVMETGNVNAFVFAHRRRRAVVGVTRGLVERMDVNEQRAVFANMMSRLKKGEMATATSLTAIMRPLWAIRERDITRSDSDVIVDRSRPGETVIHSRNRVSENGGDMEGWIMLGPFIVAAALFVIVSEIVLYRRRHTDLRRAEKADAEGMLLLKDPQSMLSALEKTVRFNNWVPNAGPGFASLFYCWTGDDTDDENDPEWRRVTRLREVLGAEGLAPPVIEPNTHTLTPPPAPRTLE
jgi:Zn-dependent protease with chaperone function